MLDKCLRDISLLRRNKDFLGIMAVIALSIVSLASCMSADGELLALEITSPQNRAEVMQDTVIVSGLVSSFSAIVEVNDQQVEIAEDGSFAAPVDLEYGKNEISVCAELDDQEPISRTLTVNRELGLEIVSPQDGVEVTVSTVIVEGTVSDPLATVMVNGREVAMDNDGNFSTPVELHYVRNSIVVSAALEGEEAVTRTLTVTRVLFLEITSPRYRTKVTDDSMSISGIVYPASALVTVNGRQIETDEDGAFVANIELDYGKNQIQVSATDPVTRTITVSRLLSLDVISPIEGAETTESPLLVSGVVSDPSAVVMVNAKEVEVDKDGTFSTNLELDEGENEILISALVKEQEPVTETVTVEYTGPED